MLRFLWLILTLAGWILTLKYLPRAPTYVPYLFFAPVAVSAVGYMYGWVIHKVNRLVFFFTGVLWLGIPLSYLAMDGWDQIELPVPVSSSVIGKIVMLLMIFFTCFSTFANYRVSLNFLHRRGNIEKGQLVRLYPTANAWESFKNLFKRTPKQHGIILRLGDEVPFKD